jgi:hypothetical protein
MDPVHILPPDLPPPADDGACDHLSWARVPSVRLQSTAGRWVQLAEVAERPEYPVERGGPTTLIKRMAWYVERGRIEKVWCPVFPPDRNAATVLEWLGERGRVLPAGRGATGLA